MNRQPRITALFMAAVFHLQFVPQADIYKTANYLRTLGITATVTDESTDKIIIETDSYNKTLEQLSPIVPKLPDIYKFTWLGGESETVLYEAPRTNLFTPDTELIDSLKVIANADEKARVTVVIRGDSKSVIQYQNVVKKIEGMGYKVTIADGGWLQFPSMDIEIPNNILSFRDALLKLSEIPEVNRFFYNRTSNPHHHEYVVSFEEGVDLSAQISKLLAQGLEVYKIDPLLNRLFIHFPLDEVQNQSKLEQIKSFKGLVVIKNLHNNQAVYSKPEYGDNVKTIWLDVPADVLGTAKNFTEYGEQLTLIAKNEAKRLQEKGMIVLHYGVYYETGEILIPEVVFTFNTKDTPKAEEILNQIERSKALCSQLFN